MRWVFLGTGLADVEALRKETLGIPPHNIHRKINGIVQSAFTIFIIVIIIISLLHALFLYQTILLSHFYPMFAFYTLEKTRRPWCFEVFSGGIK